MEACRNILVTGLASLNLALTDGQVEQLLAFVKLIEKWNKAYNLTAIRDREEMVRLHLLDSLAVLPHIVGKRVIDIGTGAGLPGIPLAIAMPEAGFTLLDSNAKKTRFVRQVVLELKLKNVEVCQSRAESYHPQYTFDTVIARAFASLSVILELTGHLLGRNGVLLAMKGQYPESELAQLSAAATLIPVRVPGIEAERCLVKIQPLAKTEEK